MGSPGQPADCDACSPGSVNANRASDVLQDKYVKLSMPVCMQTYHMPVANQLPVLYNCTAANTSQQTGCAQDAVPFRDTTT